MCVWWFLCEPRLNISTHLQFLSFGRSHRKLTLTGSCCSGPASAEPHESYSSCCWGLWEGCRRLSETSGETSCDLNTSISSAVCPTCAWTRHMSCRFTVKEDLDFGPMLESVSRRTGRSWLKVQEASTGWMWVTVTHHETLRAGPGGFTYCHDNQTASIKTQIISIILQKTTVTLCNKIFSVNYVRVWLKIQIYLKITNKLT